jgi:hypothetical protein
MNDAAGHAPAIPKYAAMGVQSFVGRKVGAKVCYVRERNTADREAQIVAKTPRSEDQLAVPYGRVDSRTQR